MLCLFQWEKKNIENMGIKFFCIDEFLCLLKYCGIILLHMYWGINRLRYCITKLGYKKWFIACEKIYWQVPKSFMENVLIHVVFHHYNHELGGKHLPPSAPLLHDGACTFGSVLWQDKLHPLQSIIQTTWITIKKSISNLELSIELKLMEEFENTYHLWIISNLWKSHITCISLI
jgi:hypothetical protein